MAIFHSQFNICTGAFQSELLKLQNKITDTSASHLLQLLLDAGLGVQVLFFLNIDVDTQFTNQVGYPLAARPTSLLGLHWFLPSLVSIKFVGQGQPH